MNVSKSVSKITLLALMFTAVQGPVLAMENDNKVDSTNTAPITVPTEKPVETTTPVTVPTEKPVETTPVTVPTEKPVETTPVTVPTEKQVETTDIKKIEITKTETNTVPTGTTVKEEATKIVTPEVTKKFVARILENSVLQGAGDYLYNGINGIASGASTVVAYVTPDSFLSKKTGAVSLTVVVIAGVTYATWRFKDNKYVSYTLGGLKSIVTSKAVWLAIGLTALTVGYSSETGSNWLYNSIDAVGEKPASWEFSNTAKYAGTTVGVLALGYLAYKLGSYCWNKFVPGTKETPMPTTDAQALYDNCEKAFNALNKSLGASKRPTLLSAINNIEVTNLVNGIIGNITKIKPNNSATVNEQTAASIKLQITQQLVQLKTKLGLGTQTPISGGTNAQALYDHCVSAVNALNKSLGASKRPTLLSAINNTEVTNLVNGIIENITTIKPKNSSVVNEQTAAPIKLKITQQLVQLKAKLGL